MNNTIENFFESYKIAFDTFDADHITDSYRTPCAISDGDGTYAFKDKAELKQKFTANCSSMKLMGYKGSAFHILERSMMGDGALLVTLGWRVKLESSEIEFRCLYLCHRIDGQWRIFTAHVYEGSFE